MKAVPFLMFQGDAKAALTLWREAFPSLEVLEMEVHGDGPQKGQIAQARIRRVLAVGLALITNVVIPGLTRDPAFLFT